MPSVFCEKVGEKLHTSFDLLRPKLVESLSVKISFDHNAKRGPLENFRYWQAMHSFAATAKLFECSDIPFFQNLANSFAELGKNSFLSSVAKEDFEFASRQILSHMASTRVNVCEEFLNRFVVAKKLPKKLLNLNGLIALGEYKSVEIALASIADVTEGETFSTSQKLLRANGMWREAEIRAQKLFLCDPETVIESGEPPHFLFEGNGSFLDRFPQFEQRKYSLKSTIFHCNRLILQDDIAEAAHLALVYSEESPLPKKLAKQIAVALGRLELSEVQRAELQAIQELPLIPLQSGKVEPKNWFPNSIQRAIRQSPPPSDCLALSSWAVSLLAATKTAEGSLGSEFSKRGSLWEVAKRAKQDPIRDVLLRDGFNPIDQYTSRNQFPISGFNIYEEYQSAPAIARIQTKRAKKFLQEASVQKSGTVLFSFHSSNLSSRDMLPTIAAARQGLNAISLSAGAAISGQTIRPDQSMELLQLPIQWVHRSTIPSAEITSKILTNLRLGGLLDIAMDVPHSSGTTVGIPWFLRPISVPRYPAAMAISMNCKIGISATWVEPAGDLVNDIIELELPAKQGDIVARSLWLSQILGRSFRDFAKKSAIPISTRSIQMRGGVPSSRHFVPLDKWSAHQGTSLSLIDWLAAPIPDQRQGALRISSDVITYDKLQKLTLRMASVLLHYQTVKPEHAKTDRNVADQHRIMLILPRGSAFIASTLASLAAGSLVALSQDDLTSDQLANREREFKPDLTITTASTWTRLLAANPDAAKLTVLIVDDRGDLAALENLVFSFSQADLLPPLRPNAPGLVIFTSGSTGRPKGVVHPCDTLSLDKDGKGVGADILFELSPSDKLAYVARWDSVCFLDILSALRSGTEVCAPAGETLNSPREMGRWLTRVGVTCLAAPSTVFGLLLKSDAMSSCRQPKLRLTMPWGERISNELSLQLYQKFPSITHIASYGASEALWIAIGRLPRPDDDGPMASHGGSLIRSLETTIVDETGNLVRQGETGNPCVNGPGVMLGYFDDMMANNGAMSPASVTLQDFARLTKDDSIELLGRSDSIIKIAGRRVSLLEIEAASEMAEGALEAHAYVNSAANPPQLFVAVTSEGAQDDGIASAVADSIAENCFASARPAQVLVLTSFPRLPSGKRDRNAIEMQFLNATNPVAAMPPENITASLVSTGSRLKAGISSWAALRHLVQDGKFDLDARVPPLSSLMVMELILIIEEVGGTVLPFDVFDPNRDLKWADILVVAESTTRREAE